MPFYLKFNNIRTFAGKPFMGFTQCFLILTCFRRLWPSYSKKKLYQMRLIVWWKYLSLWNFIRSFPSSIRGTLWPRLRAVPRGDICFTWRKADSRKGEKRKGSDTCFHLTLKIPKLHEILWICFSYFEINAAVGISLPHVSEKPLE